ncbi:MAG: hypothetical protein ACYDCK_09740 [Thermoplasmatota archaeon]
MLAALIAAASVLAVVAVALSGEASTQRAIRPGDHALVDADFFDASNGQLLASTRSNVSSAASSPHPVARAVTVTVGETSASPLVLLAPFSGALVGHHTGDVVATPPLADPYGSYGARTVDLPLLRGPFPIEHVVPLATFTAIGLAPRPGDVVELSDGVAGNATIVAVDGTNVTYRSMVSDGQLLPLPKLGAFARAHVSEDGRSFTLDLMLRPGATFGLTGICKNQVYAVEPGSYRVARVNATTATLEHAVLPFPDLIGRNITAVFYVHQVEPSGLLDRVEGLATSFAFPRWGS